MPLGEPSIIWSWIIEKLISIQFCIKGYLAYFPHQSFVHRCFWSFFSLFGERGVSRGFVQLSLHGFHSRLKCCQFSHSVFIIRLQSLLRILSYWQKTRNYLYLSNKKLCITLQTKYAFELLIYEKIITNLDTIFPGHFSLLHAQPKLVPDFLQFDAHVFHPLLGFFAGLLLCVELGLQELNL